MPTVAIHLLFTAGMSEEELAAAGGGLGYPVVLVRPRYVVQRKPAGETTGEVIARFPTE